MYCLVDEKHVVHNAAKGVPQNVIIDGERINIKNTDLYKSVLEAEGKRILWSRTLSSASTTRVSISPPRNRPRPSWGARTPRYGSWVTMCAHWPSVIIGCRVYKGEEDISLWSEKDSDESHKWVSELVRINPFERTISRWTLDEQGVVHLLYHRQRGEQGQSKITGNQRLPVIFDYPKIVLYWRGFERKFVPYRRTASGKVRISWGRGVERRFGMGNRVPMEIMVILARKKAAKNFRAIQVVDVQLRLNLHTLFLMNTKVSKSSMASNGERWKRGSEGWLWPIKIYAQYTSIPTTQ